MGPKAPFLSEKIMQTKKSKWQEIAQKAVLAVGLKWWGAVLRPQAGATLFQVFVDSPAGVTLDDCTRAAKQIRACFDAEQIDRADYHLEVSSPGVDRQLFTYQQCLGYLGQSVRCQLTHPLGGRRRFQGRLRAAENDQLTLQVEGEPVDIPWAQVAKIKLTSGDNDE